MTMTLSWHYLEAQGEWGWVAGWEAGCGCKVGYVECAKEISNDAACVVKMHAFHVVSDVSGVIL